MIDNISNNIQVFTPNKPKKYQLEAATKEINSQKDPEEWKSRDYLLQIKSRFAKFNWQIKWNHRSSNALADRIAKDSLIFLLISFLMIVIWKPFLLPF